MEIFGEKKISIAFDKATLKRTKDGEKLAKMRFAVLLEAGSVPRYAAFCRLVQTLAKDACCEVAREKSPEELINELFTYHPVPDEATQLKYEVVRDAARHLALTIWKACPYGSDRTAAIQKLRETVMTANAAIALKGLSV